MSRTTAREQALKIVYSKEINPDGIIGFFEENEEKILSYADEIVAIIANHIGEIDEKITLVSENWQPKRMNKVDLCIIRIAIAEFFYSSKEDLNKAIIINEAIELAKKYSDEAAAKFVNGVLNAALKE